jgi:hypothetical protein
LWRLRGTIAFDIDRPTTPTPPPAMVVVVLVVLLLCGRLSSWFVIRDS